MQTRRNASTIRLVRSVFCTFVQLCALGVVAAVPTATYRVAPGSLAEGEAVFLLSDHPWLGAGELPAAPRMVPGEDGKWSLSVEIPGGAPPAAKAVVRSAAAGRIADVSNGRRLAAPPAVTVEGTAHAGPNATITFIADTPVERLVARTVAGPAWEQVCPEPAAAVGGALEYRLTVPGTLWHSGTALRLNADGTLWPAEGSLRLGAANSLWVRHGEAFHHPPAAVPPSAPRVEAFTLVPADRLLAGRRVRVLLPRGYDQDPGRRYPVLYAEDGQNVFSPGSAFGSWDLDLTVTDLIARGDIPEVIVVAIDNTPARMREYMPPDAPGRDGLAGAYLDMIARDLVPEIDRRYRTLPHRGGRLHIGSSLGGILGWHAAAERPHLFGTVIAMSPSFWVDLDGSLAQVDAVRVGGVRLWIDSGTEGQSADGYANTMTVRDAMLRAGAALGHRFMHQTGAGQGHNEAAWRSRAAESLRWALGGRIGNGE